MLITFTQIVGSGVTKKIVTYEKAGQRNALLHKFSYGNLYCHTDPRAMVFHPRIPYDILFSDYL